MGHFQQLLCNSCPKAPSGFANWSYLAVVSCMRGALRTLLCWNEDWQVIPSAMKPQLCENLEPRDVTPPSPGQKSSALLLEPHTPTKGGFQELWVQSQAQSQLPWLPPCPGCAGEHQSSSQGLFLKFVSIKAHKQFWGESLISHTGISWGDCVSFGGLLALLCTLLKLVIIRVLRFVNYSSQKHGERGIFHLKIRQELLLFGFSPL